MMVGRFVIARISAITISTLSVPIPVDTMDTRWPRYVPVTEANSRWRRSSSMSSSSRAIFSVRSGSPGRRRYSASSPGPRSMWYCRSPTGSATRWSAFGKSLVSSLLPRLRDSAKRTHGFERASSRFVLSGWPGRAHAGGLGAASGGRQAGEASDEGEPQTTLEEPPPEHRDEHREGCEGRQREQADRCGTADPGPGVRGGRLLDAVFGGARGQVADRQALAERADPQERALLVDDDRGSAVDEFHAPGRGDGLAGAEVGQERQHVAAKHD